MASCERFHERWIRDGECTRRDEAVEMRSRSRACLLARCVQWSAVQCVLSWPGSRLCLGLWVPRVQYVADGANCREWLHHLARENQGRQGVVSVTLAARF